MNENWIWFAGLFEGEGWITFPKNSPNGVSIGIKMADKDVMDKVFSLAASGNYRCYERSKKNPNHSDVWQWSLGERNRVREILITILPWMGERRSSKIREALLRLESNRGYSYVDLENEHGTVRGYKAEERRGIPHCDPCRKAHSAQNLANYHKRKGRQ